MPNTPKEQKVNYGLKNAYFATITEAEDGAFTYGTPIRLPGSVELTLEPRGDMIEFYADDMLYFSAPNNQGYDGTFTLANIPTAFATECLGEVIDETDQVVTEVQGAKPKGFALLFEFDNDIKATRHVLYNCKASRPTVSSSTSTDSVEPGTSELSFVASARPSDRQVKTKTTQSTPAAIYDAWYEKVYEKTVTPPSGS